MNQKIVAAMSGGVDSSVAAALLAEQGFEVVGVTLKLLERAETGFGCCGSPADVDDARRVSEKLGIPHYTVDMAELFANKVIKPFVDDYLHGRTPNPCVECNRSVKFGHLLALANAWGCDSVATGHYARVEQGRLLKSVDSSKDQTYFLYSLTPKELSRVRFPVGALTKPQVRQKARALGLRTADKPESQEICFVPRRDYRGFVEEHSPAGPRPAALEPGAVVDAAGRTLARHAGTAGFTIGQRKGLGVTAPEPRYVIALEPETRTVVVGGDGETFSKAMRVEAVTWATADGLPADGRVDVRIRHRHTPAAATATDTTASGERGSGAVSLSIVFDDPQRAVTPGQAAVLYRGDVVIGGGVIARREDR